MVPFGFIMTRHVTSAETNEYWQLCLRQIRQFYPQHQVVIIDDHSTAGCVSACADVNVLIVTTPQRHWGRGELLPYMYWWQFRWFPAAVILHDSTFLQRHIPFHQLTVPVLPMWHHIYDGENKDNVTRIASQLNNNSQILDKVTKGTWKNKFNMVFGGQVYMTWAFLDHIMRKYNLNELASVVKLRKDRCAFERVLGAIFHAEYPRITKYPSLFGSIFQQHKAFHYTFDEYIQDVAGHDKRVRSLPCVKVWTGR